MNLALRAVLIGCTVEGTLAAMFAASGFGPCGPSNPIGYVGVIGHLPGALLVGPLASSLHFPDHVATVLIVVLQASMFSGIAYAFIRLRGRHR